MVIGNIMYSIEYIFGSQNMIFPPYFGLIFISICYYRLSSVILFSHIIDSDYQQVILEFFVQQFFKILYVFENVLNKQHFNTEFLRRECTGRFKNGGKSCQEFLNSNVKFIYEIIIVRNINVTYKILICQCYII